MNVKNSPVSSLRSIRIVLLFLIIFLIAASVVILATKKNTPKNTTALNSFYGVYLVNLFETEKRVKAFEATLTGPFASSTAGQTAKKIAQKVLGEKEYNTDLSGFSKADIENPLKQETLGIIPAGKRLATLCETGPETSNCRIDAKKISDKLDYIERLILYFEIQQKVSNVCVKADIGTTPQITSITISGFESRVYLCTGENGNLKFRAPAKNGKMERVIEEFSLASSAPRAAIVEDCILHTAITQSCDLKMK